MAKLKISHTIDEELIAWLNSEIETKRFASISHGIEYALTVVKEDEMRVSTRTKTNHIESDKTIKYIEDIRNEWWTNKNIGLSILKSGGIGLVNFNNIIQKNPDIFETKEECKEWLNNKLKTDPPPAIEKETPLKKGIIPNKPNKSTSKILVSNEDPSEPPKFTPNRNTVKCPNCSEEQLNILGGPVKKCVNCGGVIP